ncbi:hypothetical protein K432DRAFT_72638 [Lepidopterella palustris CBS 459.81]|uniref:Uncharacterized protein n=1 Tax=Lepidopterella palustris CBS 459.81 TaxID=1314670 RepID=A0A8E2JJJ2_9PEZI|nr:hypothetical protein K432DRAFT_72638 [Lepidopterella palustris CBS 459.81]
MRQGCVRMPAPDEAVSRSLLRLAGRGRCLRARVTANLRQSRKTEGDGVWAGDASEEFSVGIAVRTLRLLSPSLRRIVAANTADQGCKARRPFLSLLLFVPPRESHLEFWTFTRFRAQARHSPGRSYGYGMTRRAPRQRSRMPDTVVAPMKYGGIPVDRIHLRRRLQGTK